MILMFALALAAPVSVEADFNGDGKKETFTCTNDVLKLGTIELGCAEDWTQLEVLDIASDKPGRELAVCELGPRDDRSCAIYRMTGSAWAEVKLPSPPGNPAYLVAKGNGILLAFYPDRWYAAMEKFTWNDGKPAHIRQPLLSTVTERSDGGFTFTPDSIFPIVDKPGGTAVIANVAPKNLVTVIGESPEHRYTANWDDTKRWFLVRTSSGLVGWASLQTLIGSCEQLMMMNAAG